MAFAHPSRSASLLSRLVSGPAHGLSAIARIIKFSWMANDRMRDFERLSGKSDADLARLGYTREGLVQEIFGDLLEAAQ